MQLPEARGNSASAYRADIDGLRAIAIVSVVAFHVGVPGMTGGFTGVDIFFVISGYLITGLLLRELAESGRIDLVAFYARRVRRLLPALATMLVVILIATVVLLPRLGQQQGVARSALAAMGFVANHYFQLTTGGYFDDASELQPLLHLWSLSVEEQFYLAWPLVLAMLWRFGFRAGWVGAHRARPFAVMLAAVTAGFALSLWMSRVAPSMAFFLTPARAWELGAGALLALVPPMTIRPAVGTALSCVGVAAMGAGFTLITRAAPYPGVVALAPVLGCVFVIAGGSLAPAGIVARALGARGPVMLGRLAYGWYLWHWPMLALARWLRLGDPAAVQDALVAIAALGLAALSYRFVERRFHRPSAPVTASPRMVLRLGAVTLSVVALVATAVGLVAKHGSLTAAEQRARALSSDGDPFRSRCSLGEMTWKGRLHTPECTLGDGAVTVALWGDSHAAAWTPALEAERSDRGGALVVHSLAACPPLLGLVPRDRVGQPWIGCAEYMRLVIAWLREARGRGLRGVVLVARWPMYEGAGDISVDDRGHYLADTSARTAEASRRAMARGMRATLDLLSGLGLRVVILLPAPEFRHEVGPCLLERSPRACGITRAGYLAHAAPTSQVLSAAAAEFPDVRVLDPVDFFCDAEVCPAVRDGAAMLRDDDHVTVEAARRYGQRVAETWGWLRGGPGPR